MARHKRRRWTPTEDATLLRLTRGGVPVPGIAETLGRSYHAVVGRRELLGVGAYRRLSPVDREIVADGVRRGLPDRACARLVGRTDGKVARTLRGKLGVPPLTPSEANLGGWRTKKRGGSYVAHAARRERIMEIVAAAEGPISTRAVRDRYGRGTVGNVRFALTRLRGEGKVVCEGRWGCNSIRWFSVGWWLAENAGMVYRKAHALRRRFPAFDVEDIASQLRVEIVHCARSFRPKGWKFSTYVLGPAALSTADWCRLERNRGVYVPKSALGTTGLVVADHDLLPGGRYNPTRDLPAAPVVDPAFWETAAGVSTLTPRERDIILSHYRDGETFEGMRHRYGVTKTAIRLSAQRALKKIRAAGAMDDYAEAI